MKSFATSLPAAATVPAIEREPSTRHASASPAPEGAAGASGEEAALVRAARSGDRAAFARLHERYVPMVHGIALARAPSADVPDIVQEVFLQAMKALATLRDDGAIGPWLAMLTRNQANQSHRVRRVRVAASLEQRMPRAMADVSQSPAQREEAHAVLEVIRALPDAYAETLTLRLVEGLTGPQIAACTGLTPGGVRVNLHRGMAMLREKLGNGEALPGAGREARHE